MYLNEWKTQISQVNADYKIHIGISLSRVSNLGVWGFDSLTWWNYEDEDPDSFDHDYGYRSFNHRFQEDVLEFKRHRAGRPNILHRLTHISHVPTQTMTGVELPRNYF